MMFSSRDSSFIGKMFGVVGAIFAVCAFGWAANIYQIVKYSPALSEWTALWVIKAIGILIAPLGVALGWIGIF